MSRTPRAVIDANVVVSASLLPGSVPFRAVERAVTTGAVLVSRPILEEYDDVLRRPRLDRRVPLADRLLLLEFFLRNAELVEVTSVVTACRDPKDDKYLALAVDGAATCLVSGDADLLALHPFRGVPILTPAAFLAAVAADAAPGRVPPAGPSV